MLCCFLYFRFTKNYIVEQGKGGGSEWVRRLEIGYNRLHL